MLNRIATMVFAVAAVLAPASLVAAGQGRLDMEGGAAFLTDHVDVNGDDVNSPVHGSYMIGGGYRLTDHIELDGQFQHDLYLTLFDESINAASVTAGPRIYLPILGPLHPWASAQLGWYNVSANSDACTLFCDDDGKSQNRSDNAVGVNVGGGADVFLNKWVSTGVDLRYHRALNAFDDGFGFFTTMLNVSLHFGRATDQPAAAN